MKNVQLLLIDPQKDFCLKDGALSVPGADADMDRVTSMVDRLGSKLDDIHVTLDCHHIFDVAHPAFWKDSSGQEPPPFTLISASDIRDGVWTPKIVGATKRMIGYTEALDKGGRYPLCVWPPHCLIGTPGHAVVDPLMAALNKWAVTNHGIVDFVSKGSNLWTEHYSAIKAEVPDPSDPSTQLNARLIDALMEADVLAIAGEAGSHCLANTVRDIAEAFGDDSHVKKLVLLEDGTSPVTSFEQLQDAFIAEMVGRGMQISKTTDFLV